MTAEDDAARHDKEIDQAGRADRATREVDRALESWERARDAEIAARQRLTGARERLLEVSRDCGPRLTEGSYGGGHDWITRWFCPVPDMTARFQVLRDEWSTSPEGLPVRDIYEIKLVPAPET